MRPADATPDEWRAAVQRVYTAARGDKFLEHIPSHWLEAMRDALLAAATVCPWHDGGDALAPCNCAAAPVVCRKNVANLGKPFTCKCSRATGGCAEGLE